MCFLSLRFQAFLYFAEIERNSDFRPVNFQQKTFSSYYLEQDAKIEEKKGRK